MPRNLERRVEILFPVENEDLRRRIMHILQTELKDTEKAHILNKDGVYVKVDRRGRTPLNSQKLFGEEAVNAVRYSENENSRVFVPEMKGPEE